MARVTVEERQGWRTCGAPRNTVSPSQCPGYESVPCTVVVETTAFTFADNGSDGHAGMDHSSVERSTVTVKPLGFEDHSVWLCPHCGGWCNFSLVPRPDYEPASGQSADALLSISQRQASAADRQADALEAMVANAKEAARVAVLERELAELRALVAENSTLPASEDTKQSRSTPAKAKA
jgi:hypothetical protein